MKTIQLFVLTMLFGVAANAQTSFISFNLLTQPCNNDGVLVIQTIGMTPPITLTYYMAGTTTTVIINTVNDTLFNYSGGSFYVSGSDASTQVGSYYSGAPPFVYNVSAAPAICPALGSALATVTGGSAPFTFVWTEINTGTIVSTTNPANNLPAGNYHILITDAAGCVFGSFANQDSIYVGYSSSINYSLTTTTANCTDGTATINGLSGGISPYGYQWSNGANSSSITNLSMGQLVVTVTDAQGCYQISYGYIQQGITIAANPTATPATCLQNDGSVIAFGSGGLPPYSYMWSDGQQTQTATGLVSGYYYMTVTDANNCIGSGYAWVAASTPITVTYSSTASSCTAPTGTATVTPTGGTIPYTIQWNTYPAQSGVTATNLSPGSYSFVVTDNAGCVRTGSVYVPPISIITAQVSTSSAVCTASNGGANIIITSGAAPYSYAWNTGGTNSAISGVTAGGYNCVITDNLGCSITKYAYVDIYSPVGLSLSSTPASCIFANDGNITAIPYGGTLPYTYSWSSGSTNAVAPSLATGYYSVYVTDASGCHAYQWTNLGYNAANNSNMLITMGCGEACPYLAGLRREDWPLTDPKGNGLMKYV